MQRSSIRLVFGLFAFLLFGVAGVGIAQTGQVHSAQKPKPRTTLCHTLPKVGTLFVNTYYLTDSTGALVPKSEEDPGMVDDTQVVIASGIRAHGKSNAIVMLGPGHGDTNFIAYASNGDVYLLNTNHLNMGWSYLPFGAKQGKIIKKKPRQDSGKILGRDYIMDQHDELRVAGWDTVSVGSQRLDAVKLQIITVMQYDNRKMRGAPMDPFLNLTNYWYSPEMGYFPRINFGWGGKYFLNQQLREYDPK